jgi:hypothetical protein
MKKSDFLLLTVALALSTGSLATLAQPSGLRLDKSYEGFALPNSQEASREAATDSGLYLRFTKLPQATLVDQDNKSTSLDLPARSMLRADWSMLSPGVHTSLGLSWNNDQQIVPTGKGLSTSPTTFLGFGWDSLPSRSSRWSLSAEVGTNLSGSYGCFGAIAQGCTPAKPLGMSGEAVGNGLRLNPYISFGATYSFDR